MKTVDPIRYKATIAYDGTDYSGFQIQPNGRTIQGKIEAVLKKINKNEFVRIHPSGRTDAGVHAKQMIAHFDFERKLDVDKVCDKLNRILPHDIAIHKVIEVNKEAHARFDATARTYQYYITTRKDPFRRNYAYRLYQSLDILKMNEAAQILFEFEDFTSFSKLHSDTRTNLCTIMQAEWTEVDEHTLVFTIQANRFLRNMVRAIVGTLIEVGRGKISLEEFRKIIEEQDRGLAGASVPGQALFLIAVEYPESIFNL